MRGNSPQSAASAKGFYSALQTSKISSGVLSVAGFSVGHAFGILNLQKVICCCCCLPVIIYFSVFRISMIDQRSAVKKHQGKFLSSPVEYEVTLVKGGRL